MVWRARTALDKHVYTLLLLLFIPKKITQASDGAFALMKDLQPTKGQQSCQVLNAGQDRIIGALDGAQGRVLTLFHFPLDAWLFRGGKDVFRMDSMAIPGAEPGQVLDIFGIGLLFLLSL